MRNARTVRVSSGPTATTDPVTHSVSVASVTPAQQTAAQVTSAQLAAQMDSRVVKQSCGAVAALHQASLVQGAALNAMALRSEASGVRLDVLASRKLQPRARRSLHRWPPDRQGSQGTLSLLPQR